MTLRVYKRHLFHDRPEKAYCARGSREFFARHGLDWADFLRHGIDAAKFVATGDAMALRAVTHAQEEAERGR